MKNSKEKVRKAIKDEAKKIMKETLAHLEKEVESLKQEKELACE